jgi:hypothetical protein
MEKTLIWLRNSGISASIWLSSRNRITKCYSSVLYIYIHRVWNASIIWLSQIECINRMTQSHIYLCILRKLFAYDPPWYFIPLFSAICFPYMGSFLVFFNESLSSSCIIWTRNFRYCISTLYTTEGECRSRWDRTSTQNKYFSLESYRTRITNMSLLWSPVSLTNLWKNKNIYVLMTLAP